MREGRQSTAHNKCKKFRRAADHGSPDLFRKILSFEASGIKFCRFSKLALLLYQHFTSIVSLKRRNYVGHQFTYHPEAALVSIPGSTLFVFSQ